MTEITAEVQRVKEQIENAFRASKPPPTLVHEDTWGSEERLAIGRAFQWGRQKWQDVDFKTVTPLFDSISYLTPEAFRYYLPAFMIHSLDYNASGFVGPLTVSKLAPTGADESGLGNSFDEMAGALSQKESQAIKSFLEYVLLEYLMPSDYTRMLHPDLETADRALEYWSRQR